MNTYTHRVGLGLNSARAALDTAQGWSLAVVVTLLAVLLVCAVVAVIGVGGVVAVQRGLERAACVPVSTIPPAPAAAWEWQR